MGAPLAMPVVSGAAASVAASALAAVATGCGGRGPSTHGVPSTTVFADPVAQVQAAAQLLAQAAPCLAPGKTAAGEAAAAAEAGRRAAEAAVGHPLPGARTQA